MAGATGTASTAMAVLLSQQNFNLNLFPKMQSIFKYGCPQNPTIAKYKNPEIALQNIIYKLKSLQLSLSIVNFLLQNLMQFSCHFQAFNLQILCLHYIIYNSIRTHTT